jgi:glyceraldehyde 3-phosphate dehydrogenase
MKKRIAINGFGRIGRLAMRRLANDPELEVVAINDLSDPATLAHLYKYDSVQGKVNYPVLIENQHLRISDSLVRVYQERDPSNLPWSELNIDIVLECTGVFRDRAGVSKHITAGAKKVIISAPAKGDVPFVVLGVNENTLSSVETIVSNASCTTNCLAPMVKVLDEKFGLEKGFITTVHAYTADQRLQDAPHSDLRRARAAAVNIVPTTTGAAKAVGKVLPHLNGRLDGTAVRVPVASGSITDLVAVLRTEVDSEMVNAAMKAASENELKGILEYCVDPIVSSDIVGSTSSCVFDSQLTSAQGNLVKVFGWYDNEMGYAARLVDMTRFMMNLGK